MNQPVLRNHEWRYMNQKKVPGKYYTITGNGNGYAIHPEDRQIDGLTSELQQYIQKPEPVSQFMGERLVSWNSPGESPKGAQHRPI